jgi:hypothetical protein
MLDEANGWISYQECIPTKDGQFGWRTLQTENTVEGETESGLKTMKSVVKKLKLPTFLAARSEKPAVDWALKPSGAGDY